MGANRGPVNPCSCGQGQHRGCTGFSGGHDTWLCHCRCHTPDPAALDADTDTTGEET